VKKIHDFVVDKESDPSYLSVCCLFEDYFKRTKDLYDYVRYSNNEISWHFMISIVSSLILNKSNRSRLTIMMYSMIKVDKNSILGNHVHVSINVFLCVAFCDKKETWHLFFADQNETIMRVIGLAMHQVRSSVSYR
jgi:hypothetical protein